MKIVFFSDVHGNQYAFHAFQEEMNELQPDQVIFLGDVFGYYYGQEEILTGLRRSGYICLLGNHDQLFLDVCAGVQDVDWLCARYGSSYRRNIGTISALNIDFLKSFPLSWSLQKDGIRIGAFHGSPDRPLEGRVYPDTRIEDAAYMDYDYIFLGHTHHKMIRQIKSTVVVNPGSIGQQRDGRGCSYVIFDTVSKKCSFKIVEYNRSALCEDIEKNDAGNIKLKEVLFRKNAG